jgi:hypothetical protein
MNKDIRHSLYRLTLIGTALAVSLTASGGAEAEVQHVVATAETADGAEILMTSVACGGNNGRDVLWLARDGRVIQHGCAVVLLPDRLYISSDSGHTYVVPRGSFVTVTAAPRDLLAPHAEPAVIRRTP